jgi:hypothetical protein
MIKKRIRYLVLAGIVFALVGTAAITRLIRERDQEVSTVMLSASGCNAARQLGFEVQASSQEGCVLAAPGMLKLGGAIELPNGKHLSSNYVIGWSK